MPNRLTKFADINVAATPIKAHTPLKAPMIDGFRPVKNSHIVVRMEFLRKTREIYIYIFQKRNVEKHFDRQILKEKRYCSAS